LAEGLQINLNGIDNLDEIQKGLSVDMSARDNTILDSLFARLDGCIIHILKKNNGLCVGVRNAWAVVLKRTGDNILGRQVKVLDLFGAHLRDLPVLTELAVDIAPGCGDGESRGVRQKMEERFFFDGVYHGGAGLSIDQSIISSADILSDSTVASFFITKFAIARTELAFDFPVGQFLIIPRFHPGEVGCFLESEEVAEKTPCV
jgi:hypothetical protein